MIKVNIICLGKLKEKYLVSAVAEYEKRLTTFCKGNIIELTPVKLSGNPSAEQINQALKKEGDRIKEKLPKGSYVVSLCIEGKQISSEDLSQMVGDLSIKGKSSITFIIGSSYGLSDEIKSLSDYKLSMSKMTFPHQLARVMLLEQIYRSFMISSGGKYHK